MSLKQKLGKAVVYGILAFGALFGVPMRPDQIEKLMKLSEPKVQHVMRNDNTKKK